MFLQGTEQGDAHKNQSGELGTCDPDFLVLFGHSVEKIHQGGLSLCKENIGNCQGPTRDGKKQLHPFIFGFDTTEQACGGNFYTVLASPSVFSPTRFDI